MAVQAGRVSKGAGGAVGLPPPRATVPMLTTSPYETMGPQTRRKNATSVAKHTGVVSKLRSCIPFPGLCNADEVLTTCVSKPAHVKPVSRPIPGDKCPLRNSPVIWTKHNGLSTAAPSALTPAARAGTQWRIKKNASPASSVPHHTASQSQRNRLRVMLVDPIWRCGLAAVGALRRALGQQQRWRHTPPASHGCQIALTLRSLPPGGCVAQANGVTNAQGRPLPSTSHATTPSTNMSKYRTAGARWASPIRGLSPDTQRWFREVPSRGVEIG